jgi:hypothetical protein
VVSLEKTRNGSPAKSLLHNFLEKGMHITAECNIQGELHKHKDGDRKQHNNVNESDSQSFLFEMIDEKNGGRERKHGGCHGEEE